MLQANGANGTNGGGGGSGGAILLHTQQGGDMDGTLEVLGGISPASTGDGADGRILLSGFDSVNGSFANAGDTVVTLDLDGDGLDDAVDCSPYDDEGPIDFDDDGVCDQFESHAYWHAVPLDGTLTGSVSTEDVDGDGDPDLVHASDSGVHWLENVGGSFLPTVLLVGNPASDVAITDLDGDAIPDLIVASSVSVDVFAGLGGGSFAGNTPLVGFGPATEVTTADLFGDGFPEVLAVGTGAAWSDNAAGTPGSAVSLSVGTHTSIDAGDTDGDGDLDLVLGSTTGAELHENTGTGFGAGVSVRTSDSRLTRLADFDNDSAVDAVFGGDSGSGFAWHPSSLLSGTDFDLVGLAGDATGVVALDVDLDGDLDAAWVDDALTTGVQVALNDGTGLTEAHVQLAADHAYTSLAAGDLDGDGDDDVVTASPDGLVWWINPAECTGDPLTGDADADGTCTDVDLCWGDETFGDTDGDGVCDDSETTDVWPSVVLPTSDGLLGNSGYDLVDVDGDGDLDLIATQWGDPDVWWFENTDGVLGPEAVLVGTSPRAYDLAVADLDADGWPDLAVVDSDAIVVFPSTGPLGWGAAVTVGANGSFDRLSAADLFADGYPELLQAAGDGLRWYDNSGSLAPAATLNARNTSGTTFPDLDGDGGPDIVATSTTGVHLFRSDGATLGPEEALARGRFLGLGSGDLDGDGDPDLVHSQTNGPGMHWQRTTQGAVSDPIPLLLSHSAALDFAVVDLDLDGYPDIVWGDYRGLQVVRGTADGPTPVHTHLTVADDRRFGVRLGDLDGDGDLDAISGDRYGDWVVHYNPAMLSCAGNPGFGDTDGDGICEDIDLCLGDDSTLDSDADGLCDDVDPCPNDATDADGDGYCDAIDLCTGDDATGDSDGDAVCDDSDACYGDDATGDTDGDTVCDSDEVHDPWAFTDVGAAGNALTARFSDVDSDGDLDVLFADWGLGAIYWSENANGTFLPASWLVNTSLTAAFPYTADIADLDGDGLVELLYTHETGLDVYPGTGLLSWGALSPVISGTSFLRDLVTADLFFDGSPDVAVGGIPGVEFVDNAGGLAPSVNLSTEESQALELVDADGNGTLDVVSGSSVGLSVWPNAGTLAAETLQSTEAVDAFAFADFDDDGIQDVALAGANHLRWQQRTGGGPAPEQDVFPLTGTTYGMKAADVDVDGNVDLVWINGGVHWTHGSATGPTPTHTRISSADTYFSVDVADVDFDGDPDIVGVTLSSEIRVFLNPTRTPCTGTVMSGDSDDDGTCDAEDPCPLDALDDSDGDGTCDSSDLCLGQDASGDTDGDGFCDDGDRCPFGPEDVDVDLDGVPDACDPDPTWTFWQADPITFSPNEVWATLAEDFDGDGDLDVIASGYDDLEELYWYRNDGTGRFAHAETLATDLNDTRDLLAVDTDGDGDLDVLGIDAQSYDIYAFENTGDGFADWVTVATPSDHAERLAAADLDGVNGPDLVATVPGEDQLLWYANAGDGTFLPGVEIGGGTTAFDVALADVDGDGWNDLVLATRSSGGEVFWIRNLGSGSFDAPVLIEAVPANSVLAVDLTGDGFPDLVVADSNGGEIRRFDNDGTGGFNPSVLIDTVSTPRHLALADMDGDGDLDLHALSEEQSWIHTFENVAGTFALGVQRTEIYPPTGEGDLALGDLNGDGFVDAVVAAASVDAVLGYLGDGTGALDTRIDIGSGADSPDAMDAADIDGDGDPDLVGISWTLDEVFWFENAGVGTGRFASKRVIGVEDQPHDVKLADLDGDGAPDLLVAAEFGSRPGIYANLGGTFAPREELSASVGRGHGIDAADLDGDGLLDVVIGGDLGQISWFENLGTGLTAADFASEASVGGSGSGIYNRVVGVDLDGDGDVDVAATNREDDQLVWFENTGGSFAAPVQLNTQGSGPDDLLAADIDGDGAQDLVSTWTTSGTVLIHENGTFAEHVAATPNEPREITAADTDFDGAMDLVVGTGIGVYELRNTGAFAFVGTWLTPFADVWAIAAADLDQDGDPDLAWGDIETADFAFAMNPRYVADADGDGYAADNDCNDADANTNPGATEICGDYIDNDCSGSFGDGLPDMDTDGLCDALDPCPADAADDSDGDGSCDSVDTCPGFDDTLDTDGDGAPDDCDVCPLDYADDFDGDGLCDSVDPCPLDLYDDSDGDGTCDSDDVCPGFDDAVDTDADGAADGCDVCPQDALDDSDGDGLCDSDDVCPGFDDSIDSDGDGVCDPADLCAGDDATGDQDGDGFCGGSDCDDTDATAFPGGVEVCGDSVDQDCDGADLLCPEPVDTGLVIVDTGTDDRDPKDPEGCGCSTTPKPGAWTVALLLLALRRRRE